jgi:hypothetical protein
MITKTEICKTGWKNLHKSNVNYTVSYSALYKSIAKYTVSYSSLLPFCRLVEPRPECFKSSLLGTRFVDFWSQDRNATNRAFWSSFCRLLEPRPENAQIDSFGAHFVDFRRQGQITLGKHPKYKCLRHPIDTNVKTIVFLLASYRLMC